MKGTAAKEKKSVSSKNTSKKEVVAVKTLAAEEKTSKNIKKTKRKLYVSYNARMIFFAVLFIVSFVLSLLFARHTLVKENTNPITFKEQEIVDYKVYLKANDFYTEKYLPKDRAYIANLIDYIDVDMKYAFHIDDLTKMDVNYKVIGELVIENSNGSKRYFEKEYTIVDSKYKRLDGNNEFLLAENVKVNYDYYNELANKFRSSYGVETNSYLKLYLQLSKQTDKTLSYSISEGTKVDNIIIQLQDL